jgi:hypothetical protein
MLEAGSGVMHFAPGFDYQKRLRIWRSTKDNVIPPRIAKYIAERVGVEPTVVKGFEHDLPLQDTDGSVLRKIRKELA